MLPLLDSLNPTEQGSNKGRETSEDTSELLFDVLDISDSDN